MFRIGLTDHLEGPADRPSVEVYEEVGEIVRLADHLGVQYAWFAEHHAHTHRGHLPAPLLLALRLAGTTTRIRLGTAVTCLNLHHPLETAEQVAVADGLMQGRLAPGFGSGSTPAEADWLGIDQSTTEAERHARFEAALGTIRSAWSGTRPTATAGAGPFLPRPSSDLPARCWIAVNSAGAAAVAGRFGGNVLLSHLRTPQQYVDYVATYRAAGGRGRIAINRPVYVGANEAAAHAEIEPALRTLWRRFRQEGKIAADAVEPRTTEGLCRHPINFVVGDAASVDSQLRRLHAACPFDVANVELRWDGLAPELTSRSLERLMQGRG